MRNDPLLLFYRAVVTLLVAAVVVVLAAKLTTNPTRLATFEASHLHAALDKALAGTPLTGRLDCPLMVHGDDLEHVATQFAELGALGTGESSISSCSLTIQKRGALIAAEISGPEGLSVVASTPRIRWTALLPALLALTLAVITRKLVISLLTGVVIGGLLAGIDASSYGWLKGATLGTLTVFRSVLTDDFHLWIFVFTFSLIGLVNVTITSGGMGGVARLLARLAKSARSTQAATALIGLAVFFDDYSNTVVVGNSMRPLSDRMRISREKLAYIVDSTAAPLAGLALISTWIGYEVSLIGNAMTELGLAGSPYAMFLSTLPFRFYCILTLLFMALNIGMKREYGPMLTAQRRAHLHGDVMRPGSKPLGAQKDVPELGVPAAHKALIPIFAVVFLTLLGMAVNGAGIVAPWSVSLDAMREFEFSRLFSVSDNYIIQCEDGAWVLAMASLAGTFLALLLGRVRGGVGLKPLFISWLGAGRILLLAFTVLILAWAIGRVNDNLGTGAFLVSTLADSLAPWLVPVLIFTLAGVISFATGSSWSTMAILLPAAAPLAYHIGGLPFMVISIGAVLDGSILGDHCSPLSDTTIMSSISSGCDHLDHVRTQLPYALTVGFVAVALGYALASVVNPLLAYIGAGLLFVLILRVLGRPVETA